VSISGGETELLQRARAMSTSRPTDLHARWVLAALCVCGALLLFSFRAVELSGMSTGFTGSAARGEWHFFSHHLLYQPVLTVFSTLLSPVGCAAVCAAQVHSIIWALVAVASAYIVVLHLTRSVPAALVAGVLLLVSHNIWVFATQAEPYVPLIGINALIAAIVIRTGPGPWTPAVGLAITALFTFSLFLHQANVFFLLPLAVYLAVMRGRAGMFDVLKITVAAGAVSLGVFLLAYWLTHPEASVRGFRLWLTYYGVISDDSHGTWDALLTLDPQRLKEAGRSVVATIVTEPSDALRTPARFVVTALLLLAGLWNILYVATGRPGAPARLFLILWAATFLVFFAWWHSNVHKFFLFSVVPTLLLCALALADLVDATASRPLLRHGLIGAVVLAVGTIAYINFDRSVRPLAGDGSGIAQIAGDLSRAPPPGCVLYTKRRFGGYLSSVYGLEGLAEFRNYQMMYQAFHFGRFNPDLEETLGYTTDVNEDDCNVILLNWLSYEDFQWKGGKGMRRAREATAGEAVGPNWPEFIAWILDVRPDPAGDGILHDELVFFRAGDDEAFVRINRNRPVPADSLDALLDTIDAAVDDDPRIARTRERHRALNRFRNRVFGYS
jgi:hypothetical protein